MLRQKVSLGVCLFSFVFGITGMLITYVLGWAVQNENTFIIHFFYGFSLFIAVTPLRCRWIFSKKMFMIGKHQKRTFIFNNIVLTNTNSTWADLFQDSIGVYDPNFNWIISEYDYYSTVDNEYVRFEVSMENVTMNYEQWGIYCTTNSIALNSFSGFKTFMTSIFEKQYALQMNRVLETKKSVEINFGDMTPLCTGIKTELKEMGITCVLSIRDMEFRKIQEMLVPPIMKPNEEKPKIKPKTLLWITNVMDIIMVVFITYSVAHMIFTMSSSHTFAISIASMTVSLVFFLLGFMAAAIPVPLNAYLPLDKSLYKSDHTKQIMFIPRSFLSFFCMHIGLQKFVFTNTFYEYVVEEKIPIQDNNARLKILVRFKIRYAIDSFYFSHEETALKKCIRDYVETRSKDTENQIGRLLDIMNDIKTHVESYMKRYHITIENMDMVPISSYTIQ